MPDTNPMCPPNPCGIQKILEVFIAHFPDEIHDSNQYLDLAVEANAMHREELSEGLMGMAYDEYTHARFIYETLTAYGICIDDEHHKAWHSLEDRIQTMFPR